MGNSEDDSFLIFQYSPLFEIIYNNKNNYGLRRAIEINRRKGFIECSQSTLSLPAKP